MELMSCPSLAVPNDVMQHVVHVESSYNPYAIGVVGGRLARQPRSLAEALSTVRMLERRGYNFSVGLAQVNRHNLARYGLDSYERAFEACPNLQAGSRILAECHGRSGGDWGKSFSCYYSGNFTTGFRHGYVQKIFASMRGGEGAGDGTAPINVIDGPSRKATVPAKAAKADVPSLLAQRAGGAPAARAHQTPVPATRDNGIRPVQMAAVQPSNDLAPAVATQVSAIQEPVAIPSDQAFVF